MAVCCHDPGLQRVAGLSRGLRSLTLADLAAVRVQGHQVPTTGAVAGAVPPGRTLILDLKPEHRPRAVILQEGEPFSRVLAMALRRADAAVHVPLRTVFAAPELVQVARGHGLVVLVWTVNRAVDARLLKVLGVDAILTDVPATMRSALTPRLVPVD